MRLGVAMIALSASASASAALPSASRRRTSLTAAGPAGFIRSRFSPAQTVSSLSWRCSSATPPKTIAPRRPLPIGSASFQFAAGCVYQSRKSWVGVGCSIAARSDSDSARTAATAMKRRRFIAAFYRSTPGDAHQVSQRANDDHVARQRRRGHADFPHGVRCQQLELPSGLDDEHIAILARQVDAAGRGHWRRAEPRGVRTDAGPIDALARLRVVRAENPVVGADVDEAVVDERRRGVGDPFGMLKHAAASLLASESPLRARRCQRMWDEFLWDNHR